MIYLRHFTYICILLLSAPASAESLQLASTAWPPYTDKKLLNNGVATALVSTALERAGYKTEYNEVPWARVLYGVMNDRYDIVVASWLTPDREVYGLFSEPYITSRVVFMQRTGSTITYKKLDDLLPFKIAISRGYTYSAEFNSNDRLQKKITSNFESSAHMLAAGRVNLILDDELVAQYYLKNHLSDIQPTLEFLPNPLSESRLHMMIRRNHPLSVKIISDFNQEIKKMRSDGTYDKLLRQHSITD